MGIRAVPMFTPSGLGTPFLFAQWVKKSPAMPIKTSMVLVDGGIASRDFRLLWNGAFPNRPPLPKGRICHPDGTATDEFWFIFA